MKRILTKGLFVFLLSFFYIPMWAIGEVVIIDGIRYMLLSDSTASIVGNIPPKCDPTPFYLTGDIVIPEDIEYEGKSYKVIMINNWAFLEGNMESLTLPSSIKSIDLCAFWRAHIGKLYMTCSVEDYFQQMRYYQSNSTIISSTPLEAADQQYFNGELTTEIVIPEGTEEMPPFIFLGINTECITLPSSIRKIGSGSLLSSRLNKINFSSLQSAFECEYVKYDMEKVQSISWEHTKFCVNGEVIEHLVIPEGIETIPPKLFYHNPQFKSVSFPSSVTSIGEGAFEGNTMESINFSEGLRSIGKNAFSKWYTFYSQSCKITELKFPSTMETVGVSAFEGCEFLERVETYGHLDRNVFSDCSNLKKAIIHSGSVGNDEPNFNYDKSSFYNCRNLEELIIEPDVSFIANQTFYGIKNPMKVFSYNTYPDNLFEETFSRETYSNGALYIPKGSRDLYIRLDGWRSFRNIEEMEGDDDSSCYLTFQDAVGGRMKIKVEKGSQSSVIIEPEEGWRVLSVFFNGQDVTDALTEQHLLVTPVIMDDSKVEVVYEQLDPSGISFQQAAQWQVRVVPGGIMIDGVEGDAVQLQLYGVDGKYQRQVVVNGGCMFVALPSNGTFIVSDGRRKVKFCI